jgi:hypothetical protein
MGHKGHYGEYTGNAKWSKDHAHTKVTKGNYKASERDDAAHIDYLKRDVLYDDHHGHSDEKMTADEKHISKLAGDMKYDKKHHGSPAHIKGSQKDHEYSNKEFEEHEARVGTDDHSPVKHSTFDDPHKHVAGGTYRKVNDKKPKKNKKL